MNTPAGNITLERKVSVGTIASAFLQIVLLVVFIVGLNFRVDAAQSRIADMSQVESIQSTAISNVRDRLGTVEANLANGKDRSTQFQAETKATLAELQKQNILILQQLSAITQHQQDQSPMMH